MSSIHAHARATVVPTTEQFRHYGAVGGGCSGCPFAADEGDGYAGDPDERHFACALLGRRVWGEDSPCQTADWFDYVVGLIDNGQLAASPGEDSAVAHGQPIGLDPEVEDALLCAAGERDATAPWRLEGHADLVAFRLTTGDPRFDPAGPVCVNGYLYQPAKEA